VRSYHIIAKLSNIYGQLILIVNPLHADVFLKFKDKHGNFVNADTRSLLSLYNAAYLRSHGEALLDEAISFS
jgi:hypothetical protein